MSAMRVQVVIVFKCWNEQLYRVVL